MEKMNPDETREMLEYFKDKYETQKEKWKRNSKKHYTKVMNPDENSLDDLKRQKLFLDKRSAYQKTYYEKNREKVIERQRQYRQRIKGNTDV